MTSMNCTLFVRKRLLLKLLLERCNATPAKPPLREDCDVATQLVQCEGHQRPFSIGDIGSCYTNCMRQSVGVNGNMALDA